MSEHFLARVEAFLVATGTKPSVFGLCAVRDSAFLLNLRRGLSPTLATADKIMAYIDKLELEAARKPLNRKPK